MRMGRIDPIHDVAIQRSLQHPRLQSVQLGLRMGDEDASGLGMSRGAFLDEQRIGETGQQEGLAGT